MPFVSLNPKDHVKAELGAQEGVWEIAKARAVVHQFPPNSQTGEQSDAATMVALELFKLDPNTLERVDDEPVYEYIGCGRKNTLQNLRPGNKAKPDADEAEDLGSELGKEGNTIYADPTNGYKIYTQSALSRFFRSLTEKGFKEEYLNRGYLPDLEGTKFEVERLKTGFTPEGRTEERTVLGVKRVLVFGYERKKGTVKPQAKAAAAAAGAAGAKTQVSPVQQTPAAGAPANGRAQEGIDFDAIAKDGLDELMKQNKGREVKRAVVQAGVMTFLMRKTKLDAEHKRELISATFKDDEWLAVACSERGIGFDPGGKPGEGSLLFPAE
jgi:hypothetical protein